MYGTADTTWYTATMKVDVTSTRSVGCAGTRGVHVHDVHFDTPVTDGSVPAIFTYTGTYGEPVYGWFHSTRGWIGRTITSWMCASRGAVIASAVTFATDSGLRNRSGWYSPPS